MEQLLSCLSILNSFLLTLGVAGKEQKIKGKQKDETVEEKEEIPFLKFQISKLHHTFSGPFFISALIRDVNPGRTVTAYSAGHRNTLTSTPLKISFHSPQQTQARVRAYSTGTPGAALSPTASGTSQAPDSTYLLPPELPPDKGQSHTARPQSCHQLQVPLYSCCLWVLFLCYRQGAEADSKGRLRSITAFYPPTPVRRQSLA